MGMKERIEGIRSRAGSEFQTYGMRAIETGLFLQAGHELADGKFISAAVSGIIGTALILNDQNSRRTLRDAVSDTKITAFNEGRETGALEILGSVDLLVERQINPDDPIYTPLDGSAPISTPLELVKSLGNDQNTIAIRIGIILRHAKTRKLTVSESETLRRAKKLLDLVPIKYSTLDPKKRERIQDIDNRIYDYEREHRLQLHKSSFDK